MDNRTLRELAEAATAHEGAEEVSAHSAVMPAVGAQGRTTLDSSAPHPLPCPFCGGIVIVHVAHHMDCWTCGCEGANADDPSIEAATAAWNQREGVEAAVKAERARCAAVCTRLAKENDASLTPVDCAQAIWEGIFDAGKTV